ncbi:hypothetical protein Tco_1072198, partial [Tanacetum coccineum]
IMDPNKSIGRLCLGEDNCISLNDGVESNGEWDAPKYNDTADSGAKKEAKAFYILPDGNRRDKDKVVKKELIVALRGEIYFVKFIINLEDDDIELGVVFGRSFLREGSCWICPSRDENSSIDVPNPNSFNDSPNIFTHPPQPQYESYSCELCGNDSHYGYDCPPRFSLVYEQEPCYNQNFSDNYYPQNSSSFPQQYLNCKNVGVLMKIINVNRGIKTTLSSTFAMILTFLILIKPRGIPSILSLRLFKKISSG